MFLFARDGTLCEFIGADLLYADGSARGSRPDVPMTAPSAPPAPVGPSGGHNITVTGGSCSLCRMAGPSPQSSDQVRVRVRPRVSIRVRFR